MLRVAICDDMTDFLVQAAALVSEWKSDADDVVVECFSDGEALIDAHFTSPFDMILLDIVMPRMNGIETAAHHRRNDRSVKLVFLTSSPEYALESYSVHADNYLLKPLDRDRLYVCLDDLYTDIADNSRYILIRDTSSVHSIALRTIEYAEAQGKHVIFSMSDGMRINASEPLYFYEDRLTAADGFFKCHRSYIVNVFRIRKYTPKEITMRTGCRIPISRGTHKCADQQRHRRVRCTHCGAHLYFYRGASVSVPYFCGNL